MTIELWLAFTLAAAGLIMIPGPTVLLVVGFGFSAGTRAAFLSMIGVALGDIAAIALSFLGVGALLAVSAELFMLLKFAGALYLLYLGIKLWRAPVTPLGEGAILPPPHGMIGKVSRSPSSIRRASCSSPPSCRNSSSAASPLCRRC